MANWYTRLTEGSDIKLFAMGEEQKVRKAFARVVSGELVLDEYYYYTTVRLVKVETDAEGVVVSETVVESVDFDDLPWWEEGRDAYNKKFLGDEE